MFLLSHIFIPLILYEIMLHFKIKITDHIYRLWLMVGAVLPDLIDKPLALLFPSVFSGRGVAHSPFFIIILTAFCWIASKKNTSFVNGIVIGNIFHLLLDLPGDIPWLWPFMPYKFYNTSVDTYFQTLMTDPIVYIPEIVSFVGLLGIAIYYQLFSRSQVINWNNVQIFLYNHPVPNNKVLQKK